MTKDDKAVQKNVQDTQNTNNVNVQKQTQVTPPNPAPAGTPTKDVDDNTIFQTITVGGRTFKVSGKVNLDFTEVVEPTKPDPEPPVVNPPTEPPVTPPPTTEPTKPEEGVLKKGGWGANMDPKTWVRTVMKNPATEFKVTDGTKNVATNFKTPEAADNFIKFFQRHPDQIATFFDIDEPTTPEPPIVVPPTQPGGVEGEFPYPITGKFVDSTFRGPTKRTYASGKPDDWTIEKNTKGFTYANVMSVADVTLGPASEWEHDDNVNIKIGGDHGDIGWFSNTMGIYKGETGLGHEIKHPKTESNLVKGITCGDQRGQRVQVASTYFSDTNVTEYWRKTNGKWEKCCGAADVGGFKPKINGKEQQSQLRIDGFAGKDKPPTIHSFRTYEIKV